MRLHWKAIGLAVLGTLILFGGLSLIVESWRYQTSLNQARREMASERWGPARERLVNLASRWPDQAEVFYHLGRCEQAEGHWHAALTAWKRVPPGSPQADEVALMRAVTMIEHQGRFADAEALLEPISHGNDRIAAEARQWLIRLAYWQGREIEIRHRLEDEWSRPPHRFALLREHWRLDAEPRSIEAIRTALDRAVRLAPDDDRVRLGRANLALRTGRLAKAEQWLDACLQQRPDDPAVWSSRLIWARAADQPAEVRRALQHLPIAWVTQREVLALRSWLAKRRGNRPLEQQILESRLVENPGDAAALERLAELAFQGGQPDRAGELRRRKAEIDEATERYRAILSQPSSPTDAEAEELAHLAETLGRWFEARGWWTLVLQRQPAHRTARGAIARLDRRLDPSTKRDRADDAISDLLADLARSIGNQKTHDPSHAGAPPRFQDRAKAAGLRFVHDNGRSPAHHLPETMSGGVALLDFDQDGWLDLYAVQGGPFPPDPSRPAPPFGDRLFRNRGDGTFEDVTAEAGLTAFDPGYGHGVTVGDYDNDGNPDLFITRWRSYALYRNRGDGTFEDVTAEVGLDGDRDWPTSAAFADLDADGDLDLYVCHYLGWDPDHPPFCPAAPYGDGGTYCDPRRFPALPDHLFRNDGNQFVDVTATAGLHDTDGRGLGVVAAHLDDDHRIDLYVANDTTANFLFRNRGGLHFEETGLLSGVAASASGGYQAGMGIACGDLNHDGLSDLAVTNFYGESTTYYRNLGDGFFLDETSSIGLAAPSRHMLGFGIVLLDFNNDGRLDLASANGHVNDYASHIPYAMPALLLAGTGDSLLDVSDQAGPDWQRLRVGRGMAQGDLDNDGRIDLVMISQNAPLTYFHNQAETGRFLTLQLEGTTSNRDAIGAVVTVDDGRSRQVAQRFGGGSYQSSSDPRLHFGFGPRSDASDVNGVTVEVVWPSGHVDTYRNLQPDRGFRLREGQPTAQPLSGFGPR